MPIPSLRPKTLRGRLALGYTLLLAGAMCAMTLSAYTVARHEEQEEVAGSPELEGGAERVLAIMLWGYPPALLLALLGGIAFSRRALAPLSEVVRIAAMTGAENLDARIPLQAGSSEEVAQLVGSLNTMLERIDRSVSGTRRFTADAAHELRTPIAALRAELEIDLRRPRSTDELRGTMGRALEELASMGRLVESLLLLARSDAGEIPLARVDLELAPLVRRIAEPFEAIAKARDVTLELALEPDVRVSADPLWFGRAAANLIDNACKFTPAHGRVQVVVLREGEYAVLRVDDSGPGFRDDPRLFERFYRGAATRGSVEGAGLGLAVTRELIRAHAGTIDATRAPLGGARLRVVLRAL